MLNNYVKTQIYQMARRTGTTLTERHMRILEFAADYYEKNKVGPLYRNLERYTGAAKRDIEALFPHGLNSVYTWIGIPIHSVNDNCKPVAEVPVDDFREVYFDHNATTYIRDEVHKILAPYYSGKTGYGNPSSSTVLGKTAFDAIRKARGEIAGCLGVKQSEVIFTGSGSEANNLAIKGTAFKYFETKGHIITSRIEHSSVLESVQFLGMLGYSVTFLDVDDEGVISVESVKDALTSDTLLVAIMAVNNEIGTINPVAEIGEVCRKAEVPFLVDAVQAFGKIELRPKEMGISFLAFSAHKVYGPKGVGALYVDDKCSLVPLVHGGSQEFGRRAGTENVGHIMAFGRAAKLACREMKRETKRLAGIRDYFLERLRKTLPDHVINGSLDKRAVSNLNVGFANVDSGALLISLNRIGIYVSSGSACSAGSREASPVLSALGVDTEQYGSIRFSFGLRTTREDVDYLFKYLPQIIDQLKNGKSDT